MWTSSALAGLTKLLLQVLGPLLLGFGPLLLGLLLGLDLFDLLFVGDVEMLDDDLVARLRRREVDDLTATGLALGEAEQRQESGGEHPGPARAADGPGGGQLEQTGQH